MDISLINAGLAGGMALAAVPVILHLFMKQKPKRVIFPALRLIRERQKRSRKKLKVKNWLLLLARMALLALMALALARPRIFSQTSVGAENAPTAMALVIDTSLSMGYKQPDKTRLDLAKEEAIKLLDKTPSSSAIFVIDSAEPTAPPPLAPNAAKKRIEGLTIRPVNRPLNTAVGQAYTAVSGSDKPRHEVYVLTDLARSAWDMDRPAEGLETAAKDKSGVRTFVLRLTPKDVTDVAVTEARPTADVVTEGEPLEVVAKVRSLGPATTRVAELRLDGQMKDKKPIDIPANGEVTVRFLVPKVDATNRLHQGKVQLTGAGDPMEFDDARYFTFTVQPAPTVLVVSDVPDDSRFIIDAIDPDPAVLTPGTPRPFRAEMVSTEKFPDKSENLSKKYRCIFLNNVSRLGETEWGRLNGYVREGGGLVIGLGRRTSVENYATPTAAQVLPATLEKPQTANPPTSFSEVADFSHPLFNRYSKEISAMLGQVPVSKFWLVKPMEGARTLVSYADKSPALVERIFKGSRTGRVLLWTTPLSRRAETTNPDGWNEFPEVGWSFWFLMNQSVSYVTGTTEESLNFDAGKDVILPIDPTRRFKNYTVQDPDRKSSDRLTAPDNSAEIVVVAPQQLGNWSVKASGSEGNGTVLGFSVNPPVTETQFVPLEKGDLDHIFGEKKYALAEERSQIKDILIQSRIGSELFPWLMMAIMVVVALEGVLANRFYKEAGTGQPTIARQPA